MIMDPCNAVLDHPLYIGGGSGTMVRCSSTFLIGDGAAHTACGVFWTPGLFADGTTANNRCIVTQGASDPSGLKAFDSNAAAVPGTTQLASATVGTYRCVGACMIVTPNASVMNRSGRAYIGIVDGTVTAAASTATVALNTTIPQFNNIVDLGAGSFEVNWRPDSKDEIFTVPSASYASAAAYTNDMNGHATFGFVATGMPAATGVTVRCVAIYEIVYTAKFGTAFDMSRNRAVATLDQVLNYIEDVGFTYASAHGMPALGMGMKLASGVARMAIKA